MFGVCMGPGVGGMPRNGSHVRGGGVMAWGGMGRIWVPFFGGWVGLRYLGLNFIPKPCIPVAPGKAIIA